MCMIHLIKYLWNVYTMIIIMYNKGIEREANSRKLEHSSRQFSVTSTERLLQSHKIKVELSPSKIIVSFASMKAL